MIRVDMIQIVTIRIKRKIRTHKKIAEQQAIADKAAQDYNDKYRPAERAQEKGYNVQTTANGGVSFQGSGEMYMKDGKEVVVTIEATGSRVRTLKQQMEKQVWIKPRTTMYGIM